jgi:hypothetical protein
MAIQLPGKQGKNIAIIGGEDMLMRTSGNTNAPRSNNVLGLTKEVDDESGYF